MKKEQKKAAKRYQQAINEQGIAQNSIVFRDMRSQLADY